jgi:hypothetical protein
MYRKIFLWLTSILYPNGRAFRMPEPLGSGGDTYVTEDEAFDYTTEDGFTLIAEDTTPVFGGILHRLHEGIAVVQDDFWSDSLSILDSVLADNSNFTIDDAHDWYRRLGIYDSGLVPLADMMLHINQKLNYPGEMVYGRSTRAFIEQQLRDAGFDVHVYENRFPDGLGGYITRSPADILGVSVGEATYGDLIEYDDTEYDGDWIDAGVTLCVNYLEEDKDAIFDIGSNYRSTFYVAGATVDAFASVPIDRKIEFRQLLLQIKPAQTVGILFVNYV